MNKIVAEIPINNMGYGRHALLLLKKFIMNNECQIIPLNGHVEIPQFIIDDQEFYTKLKEAISSRIDSNIYFKFWHEHNLIADCKYDIKIGFSTFEIANPYVNTNCDIILTASSWGRDILKNAGYKSDVIFGRLPLPIYEYDKIPEQFIHIGKYELRKQTQYLVDAFVTASTRTNKELVLNIVCFNPFSENTTLEQSLLRYGFTRMAHVYRRANLTINLFNKFISDNHLLELKKRSIHIYPGGSEGANLSLLESLNYHSNDIFIEPIYCPTTAHADLNQYLKHSTNLKVESMKAYDGIFFKDHNTQNEFYRIELESLINQILTAPQTNTYTQISQIDTIDNIFYKWINSI